MTQAPLAPTQFAARLPAPFRAPFAPPDRDLAAALLADAARDAAAESRIDVRARRLVEAIRAKAGGLGGIEDFLHAYSLSTKEGLALMVLAEALLRVPDAATADRLIEDKLAAGRWLDSDVQIDRAAGLGVGLDARHRRPHHSSGRDAGDHSRQRGAPARTAGDAGGDAAGDAADRLAFRDRADHRGGAGARPRAMREFRYSFDMLGEGARTAADAERYFDAYAAAIAAIGDAAGNAAHAAAAGHFGQALGAASALRGGVARARAEPNWCRALIELARLARAHDLQFTVDAEEADRLELSLDVIGAVLADAVACAAGTASGSRCRPIRSARLPVIDWVEDAAAALDRRLTVRLVKGAYWDTEVKRGAGARPRRLSGVHPQGDDRSLLHGLCEKAARRAAAAVSAIRHPQCAHRRRA